MAHRAPLPHAAPCTSASQIILEPPPLVTTQHFVLFVDPTADSLHCYATGTADIFVLHMTKIPGSEIPNP